MAPPQDPERRRDRAALAATVAAAFLAFAPTLRNGFLVTWDDAVYVLVNPNLELSLETVGWAFQSLWHLWAPLTWLSFALDQALWGAEPFGYHLTNTLCHAAAAGLVFRLAAELLARALPGSAGPTRRWAALVAALTWALHPLRVESVAWIAERKDVLAALFGVPAVLAYLRHADGPARPFWRSRPYWAAVAFLSAALCAKSSLVTLPLVLLVLDWYPLRRLGREPRRALLLEKLPFAVPVTAATWFTLLAHEGAGHPISFETRVLVALRSLWEYAALVVWPAGLSPFHLHPLQASAGDPAFLLPAAGVLALSVAAAAQARRRPALLATWLAYLALALPGLAATQVSDTEMADRFTFFPSVPVSILAAGLLAALWPRLASVRARAAIAGGTAAVLALLCALTVRQGTFWRDDVTLWTRAIDLSPRASGRVYFQRATAYAEIRAWPEAIADMNVAVAIAAEKRYGRMQDLYGKRAWLRAEAGDLTGAAADLTLALDAEESPSARKQLHDRRGELFRAMGREDLAAREQELANGR